MSNKLTWILGRIKPLGKEDKEKFSRLSEYLRDKDRLKLIKSLLRQKKISIFLKNLDSNITEEVSFPQIKAEADNIRVEKVNKSLKEKAVESLYDRFSEKSFETITQMIAPNISGLDNIKKAAAIQLFSKQPIHILLIGDPGTGKTEILRSAFNLSPVSSFGLGSGTSGAGLVVSVKGNSIVKGLLPLADEGICAIDELNLMKEENRAGLYNAMEKGFVTYDKGGKHYQFDARVKVLATANPKGDSVIEGSAEEIKKQMPFDSALLTRFHLVFLVRKPEGKNFKKVTESIVSGEKKELNQEDIGFVKDYINHVNEHLGEVEFPKGLQQDVVNFIETLKKDENDYLVDVGPRLVIGFMRLCKGLAVMEKRGQVEEKDLERIKSIIKESLSLK
ncbi:hypothetical protein GF336_07675 [Candidatus Woesearchaeota archaeon]|nr:hypothetical protein [Candidatus Woesearchaeota archaeon]